tara:strand:+ start:217 stop:1818 length:1602 start_codon:yes stop_codon:yes gene_type:complete
LGSLGNYGPVSLIEHSHELSKLGGPLNEREFKMNQYKKAVLLFTLFLFVSLNGYGKQINFLHIIIDDLRAQGLSVYGKKTMETPNIEALASTSIIFKKAYINIPTCGASRASMLTGLYGRQDRFREYTSRLDKDAPETVSLPAYLKDNGYQTLSFGKVIHTKTDSLHVWSNHPWRSSLSDYRNAENIEARSRNSCITTGVCAPSGLGKAPAFEMEDEADNRYPDGDVSDAASAMLEYLNKMVKKEPFYMAVGFVKPHLPFAVPKKYWDLYDSKSIKVSEAQFKPKGAPPDAWMKSGELRNGYTGIPAVGDPWENNLPEELIKTLTHGYYASTSFIDAQIGKLINSLDNLELASNTVVILSSDHGFSLADHALWNKHSLFNVATRVPLLVRLPGERDAGSVEGVVEYVDIYPTIVDLANLSFPTHLAGISLKKNLFNPELPTKEAVFPRYQQGDNVTTKRYSYSAYFGRGVNSSKMRGHMLYDHLKDPLETVNVVDDSENADTVLKLQTLLLEHITQNDPKRVLEISDFIKSKF